MALYFDKYAQEGNEFIHKLAIELGHPEERERTSLILKAVLHTLRDRIAIPESFHLLAQLPMFLKAVYVDQWKYHERPASYKHKEDFVHKVEEYQRAYGEVEFPWEKSTLEITSIVLAKLGMYLTEGQISHIMDNLPDELCELIEDSMLKKQHT